jgi:hypothetical protein
MLVEVQHRGHAVMGLNVGASNVRRYFPKGTSSIDLHLDHLEIQCRLEPDFWKSEPQISDPRLSAWLEAKNLRKPAGHDPVVLKLVPADKRSFRLQVLKS